MESLRRSEDTLAIALTDNTVSLRMAEGAELELPTDGRKHKLALERLGDVTARARWHDGALELRRDFAGGIRVEETFERGPGSPRLMVLTKISGSGPRDMELRRVYDLASETGPAAAPQRP